jgi:Xaa-Pro aminopeptidase
MNPANTPPIHDLKNKWSTLRDALRTNDADACLITTNVNLYYLTGTIFNGYLYISADETPLCFTKRDVPLRNDIQHIAIRKPEDIPAMLKNLGKPLPQHLLLEGDQIAYNEYTRLQQAFNTHTSPSATTILRRLRMIKTPWEIAQLRQSARIQAEVQALVPGCFRMGISDIEFQVNIEKTARLHGSLGIFRGFGSNMEIHMGSVLAGDNAETPSPYDFALGGEGIHPAAPVGANGTIPKPGTSIMVDIGGAYTAYISDMTRTYALGSLPQIAHHAHQTSIDIQETIIRCAKPNLPCADMYRIALDTATKAGLDKYFMGTKFQAKFVGHGLGLEINEPPVLMPRSTDTLQENMTFALEPKFVIPGVGAVGIENTFLVTHNGLEKLTRFPEEIIPLTT